MIVFILTNPSLIGRFYTHTPCACTLPSTYLIPAPPNWLKLFANLTTDTVKPALHTTLRPLTSQGLTHAFVHNLIIERQMCSSELMDQFGVGINNAEVGDVLRQASLRRQGVDKELSRHVTPATTTATIAHPTSCRAAASYYFPVTQYVASQFGAAHSGTGLLEEVRLIVSGGSAPDGQAGE